MAKNTLIRLLIPVLKKNPLLILLLPILAAAWYSYEHFIARPAMSYMGIPEVNATQPMTGVNTGFSHILRNQGFMLEYSESLKNPLWVTYKVEAKKYKSGKRPSGFSKDWRTIASVSHSDYTGSGFDRGHMAPNYLISSRYGKSAQKETFLMTNIVPQNPKLNQKTWQRLEEIIANDFAEWHGDFWVVTGPIFKDKPKVIKKSGVAIPTAFYKILIKPSTPETPAQALAFIFPQKARPKSSLMKFVSTIDEIEEQTGIDFFHQLDDEFEFKLESSKTPEAWNLKKVANRPSRY